MKKNFVRTNPFKHVKG